MNGNLSLPEDRDRADDEVDALKGFHTARAQQAQRRAAAYILAFCAKGIAADDILFFVDRLPDMHGVGGVFAIALDGGRGVQEGKRRIGDTLSHLAIERPQAAPAAQLLQAAGGGAHPFPVEHVVEVLGDDEERFFAKLYGEVVSEPERRVGRE